MMFARIFNGVGLALVIPAIQSIVANCTAPEERGFAFGRLCFAGNMGYIIGGFFTILLAGNNYFGYSGWRVAFHLTAAISYILAFAVHYYTTDPTPQSKYRSERFGQMFHSLFQISLSFFKKLC